MDTAAQGFQGNGQVGTFYTFDQYREMANKDLEEMGWILSKKKSMDSEGHLNFPFATLQ
jgi:hypothetical protein